MASEAFQGNDHANITDQQRYDDIFELLAALHENKVVTPDMVEAISYHAGILGPNICKSFNTLNAILERKEELLRWRWKKKTTAQRLEILLESWPLRMPARHRPDVVCSFSTESDQGQEPGTSAIMFPFINEEDLKKPEPLLVFINARGRHAPWTFALTEMEHCIRGQMLQCEDENFCLTTTIEFSKETDPNTYGKINTSKDPTARYTRTDTKIDFCARHSLQLLLMQEMILAFLLRCTLHILHDLDPDDLSTAKIVAEPPISQIFTANKRHGTSFADALFYAPYQHRSALDFGRLLGLVEGVLNSHKEHVFLLRENPGYFADTVQEHLEHQKKLILDSNGQPHPETFKTIYKARVVNTMLNESYWMLAWWSELHHRLVEFEAMLQQDQDIQQQAHHMQSIKIMAGNIASNLNHRVSFSSIGAPEPRKLFRRFANDDSFGPIENLSDVQIEFFSVFGSFSDSAMRAYLKRPAFLSFILDRTDRFIQSSPVARDMVTGRIMTLLTDYSVAAECMRQESLWSQTPEVQAYFAGHVCDDDCDHQARTNLDDFTVWLSAHREEQQLATEHIFPLDRKLAYPEDKKRHSKHVETMREAEHNLDKFWAAVDANFKKVTGIAQHESISRCLKEMGPMSRTAPWEGPRNKNLAKGKADVQHYESLSGMSHDKALQITGAFDKLSVEGKIKQKTRGDAHPAVEPLGAVHPVNITAPDKRTFTVNKMTYKIMTALFHVSTDEHKDVSRSVKWNDFTKAMANVGFAVDKLQGSAWQFTPTKDVGAERSIQFHEPHPNSDITYFMAKRFGRRLFRVYGWHGGMFRLA